MLNAMNSIVRFVLMKLVHSWEKSLSGFFFPANIISAHYFKNALCIDGMLIVMPSQSDASSGG
jgi:hypothetical protein